MGSTGEPFPSNPYRTPQLRHSAMTSTIRYHEMRGADSGDQQPLPEFGSTEEVAKAFRHALVQDTLEQAMYTEGAELAPHRIRQRAVRCLLHHQRQQVQD